MYVMVKLPDGSEEFVRDFIVRTEEGVDGAMEFDEGNPNHAALLDYLMNHDRLKCTEVMTAEELRRKSAKSLEYSITMKSYQYPGRETHRYVLMHDFGAESPEHAKMYALGLRNALLNVRNRSYGEGSFNDCYNDGYMCGIAFGLEVPREVDMTVKAIGEGWRVSFMFDE